MNVNENNEFKGKVVLDGASKTGTVSLGEKSEFKEKFDKMLMDSNFLAPQDGLIGMGISPLIEFDNSSFDVGETHSYDTDTIENVDAMFFLNISNQGNAVNLKVNDDLSVIDASNYKTMEVSKTLGDLILKAQENNKAVRLDFDDHVTVVLKVSREGKIDATFIPQDKEVEKYLRNNIDYLKVRFDEQSIAYSNISYKPYKQKQNNNKQQGDKQ